LIKDVTVKITGTVDMHQRGEEPRRDVIEFITDGRLMTRGKVTKVVYNELEDSGMYGMKTSVIVTPNMVRVERRDDGEKHLEMVFREGHRYNGEYSTPYGNIGLELLTNCIEGFEEGADIGSKLKVDYSIALKGLSESNNLFELEILGEDEDR
jgi:uncharacterized beta-barrel protein YwiB (DUF1934 family)